jgi:hypothetical protein
MPDAIIPLGVGALFAGITESNIHPAHRGRVMLWATAWLMAVSAGANVKAVQRMLGHASASMTLDTYADLIDDDLDAVAVGLDTARSSRIVSMSVSMAPKPYAKEPLLPLVSKDVGVLSLAVPVGAVGSPQDCLLPNPSTKTPKQKARPLVNEGSCFLAVLSGI